MEHPSLTRREPIIAEANRVAKETSVAITDLQNMVREAQQRAKELDSSFSSLDALNLLMAIDGKITVFMQSYEALPNLLSKLSVNAEKEAGLIDAVHEKLKTI